METHTMNSGDPHAKTRTLAFGAALEDARAAMILLHGRGASPEDILGIAAEIEVEPVAYLAPAAGGNAWYPQVFTSPQAENQPWLGSALARIDGLVQHLLGA